MVFEHRESLGRHSRSSSTTGALFLKDLQGGVLNAHEAFLTKITGVGFAHNAVVSARGPKAGSGPLIHLAKPEPESEHVKHECINAALIEEPEHEFDAENESEASSLCFVELVLPEEEGTGSSLLFGFTTRVKLSTIRTTQ